jgi:periplasmic protein TonB
MTTAALADDGWRTGDWPANESMDREFFLSKYLLVSMGLHALCVLPIALFLYLTPAPSPTEPLVVELFGMLSTRQVEEKQLGEQVDRKVAELQKHSAAQRKSLPSAKQSMAESPVRVEKLDEKQEVQREQVVINSRQGAEEQKQQQTIPNNDLDPNIEIKYAIKVGKIIKGKLSYPTEARPAGNTGIPTVSFFIDVNGEIEPGTLVIRQSSGYPELDEGALRAARAATPFPPPPHARHIQINAPIDYSH